MSQMFKGLKLTGPLTATDVVDNFRKLNIWAIDQSRQTSTQNDPDSSSSSGSVTSIGLTAATKRVGDIVVAGGTGITISNSAKTFTWSTNPSSTAPQDVLPDNTADAGSSSAVSAVDHVHEADTAAWGGAWATASDIGIANDFLRSDGNLKYPEALYSGTETLTLSDSGANLPLTSSVTDGYLDLVLSRVKGSGVTAMRMTWDRTEDLGGGTAEQNLLDMGVTDDGGTFVSLAKFMPDFSPNHSGSTGPAWILTRPTTAGGHADTFAWIGAVKEDATTSFSGIEFASSGNSFSFFLNGGRKLASVSGGIQVFGASSNAVQLATENNKGLQLICNFLASKTVPMVRVLPSGTTNEPNTGTYLFRVDSSVSGTGDTPRFGVWGEGRGVDVPTGDYTALGASKGLVNVDGNDYMRWYVSDGTDSEPYPVVANIGASAP